MFPLNNQLNSPFGDTGNRPLLGSAFTDFVSKRFAYNWGVATYTIRPLFLLEWLEQYSQKVSGRRFFIFDQFLHATMCYFIVCVKIAQDGTALAPYRSQLNGLAVPTFVQDAHSAFPMGGQTRSQPFDFVWVFCPIWTLLFNATPNAFLQIFRAYSRSMLENGFPVVQLNFDVYYEQAQNMITSNVTNRETQVPIVIDRKTTNVTVGGEILTTDVVDAVTIRYSQDSQLAYNWQTTYFTWFSISCDQFNDLYSGLAKEYVLERPELGGFINHLVIWYCTTRGGGSPVPNFGGTGGQGPQPPAGQGGGPSPNPPSPTRPGPSGNPPRGGGNNPNNPPRTNKPNNGGPKPPVKGQPQQVNVKVPPDTDVNIKTQARYTNNVVPYTLNRMEPYQSFATDYNE